MANLSVLGSIGEINEFLCLKVSIRSVETSEWVGPQSVFSNKNQPRSSG